MIKSDELKGAFMNTDEQTIRNLVSLWHRATASGDVDTILTLIAKDAVFLVAGQPPMRGRDAFERGLRDLLMHHRVESSWDVQEVEVSGNLAYCWTHLQVRVISLAGGEPTAREGSALSILRKQSDGSWILIRDANLLSAAT
jgi:uncharacterized protein (TIGR02246 family)